MNTQEFDQHLMIQRLHSVLMSELPVPLHMPLTRRFAKHAPLLLDRLQKLYGSQPGYADWLLVLIKSLGSLAAQRSEVLQQLDDKREENKDWFLSQNNLGYCAYVDRLGGTLAGVEKRIPHLKQLGVSYLHLLPFLRARDGENDGGFAVANFDQIQPELGTMQDLSALCAALRAVDISLCSDFILNHVADTHPFVSAALQGDVQALEFFHTYSDRSQIDKMEANLHQVFPMAAPGNFTYNAALQRWVWTTFYPYQWDLNYANPAVFSAMISALLSLANQGVEVFRLDSTAYLWKREGTGCMNQPEVHWLLQAMRCIVDIVAPGVLLKAEAIVTTDDLLAYLGDTVPECQLAYHSTLMAAAWAALTEQKVDLLQKVIAATPRNRGAASWLTYVRCHDDIGWNVLMPEASLDHRNGTERLVAVAQYLTGADGGFGRGVNFQTTTPGKVHGTNGMTAALTGIAAATSKPALQDGIDRLLLLYGLAFSFGGLPLIYMGDEFAQGNFDQYLSDPLRAFDSRWLQRPFFNDAAMLALDDPDSKEAATFSGLRALLQVRAQAPALSANSPRFLLDSGNKSVLAFARGRFVAGDVDPLCLICLFNFSELTVTLDLSLIAGSSSQAQWVNRLDASMCGNELVLAPWSQCWLSPVPDRR